MTERISSMLTSHVWMRTPANTDRCPPHRRPGAATCLIAHVIAARAWVHMTGIKLHSRSAMHSACPVSDESPCKCEQLSLSLVQPWERLD